MNHNVRIIDSMDISDSAKKNIHKSIDESKRNFLNDIGNLIEDSIPEDIDPYVEHTNQGLNLRITTKNSVKEIKAIAGYAGLVLVSDNKTNLNSEIAWLRFTVE